MNCPKCKGKLVLKRWITSSFVGDWVFLEVFFWIIVTPLLIIGIWGYIVLFIISIAIIISSWGKRWYICQRCGNRIVKKVKDINQ